MIHFTLRPEHTGIFITGINQIFMLSNGHNFTVIHNHNLIGINNGIQMVGY